jgi:[protein-PII] uridylyltransferase
MIFPNLRYMFELTCDEKGSDYLLKLTLPENRKGIIYRVTAVLFAHGWDILEANFEILSGGMVKDIFLIRSFRNSCMDSFHLSKIENDLHKLFEKDLAVIDYLEYFPDLPLLKPSERPPSIQIFNPASIDSTVLDIRTTDRPGLLFEISQLLYLFDIDIVSVTAKSEDGLVRDSFLLRQDASDRLTDELMEKIKIGLQKLI